MDIEELNEFISSEVTGLQIFIQNDCIEDSDYNDKADLAIKKTIDHIVAEMHLHYESQISGIKEAYAEKLQEEQQKILDRYSELLNKVIQ
jgi:hypothetical protein